MSSFVVRSRTLRQPIKKHPIKSASSCLDSPSGLSVTGQHDDDSKEVKERRRQQQDPAERRQRRYGNDIRHIGEQVGKAHPSTHGQPNGVSSPAPKRDGVRECERGPLNSRAVQESNFKTGRGSNVEEPKPDVRSDPGHHEKDGIFYQGYPEISDNQEFEVPLNQ